MMLGHRFNYAVLPALDSGQSGYFSSQRSYVPLWDTSHSFPITDRSGARPWRHTLLRITRGIGFSLALGAFFLTQILAQLPLPLPGVGGIPVFDATAVAELIARGIQLAQELKNTGSIDITTINQLIWDTQIFTNKLPWTIPLPTMPVTNMPTNTVGDMATWGISLATGQLANPSWNTAATTLGQLGGIVFAGSTTATSEWPGAPWPGNPGDNPYSQIGSIDAIQNTGITNLQVLGDARDYLTQNLPAITSLNTQIADPSLGNNGPDQVMQTIALAQAQANASTVQSLQVNASILESLTALTKVVGDSATADFNIQAKRQQVLLTQPTDIGDPTVSLMTHP